MDPRKYLGILEHAESSSFSAHVPDLPGCVSTGQTRQECLQNIREAISMHIDGMREDGLAIPEPSSEADYVDAVASRRRRGSVSVKFQVVAGYIALLVCAAAVIIVANHADRKRRETRHAVMLRVRVASLDNGVCMYKLACTANRYFPGQDPESLGALVSGTSPEKYPNCQNAGSALLARCLFTDPNGTFPVSSYGQFERDMLGTVAGVPNTLVDGGDPPMAILYFPARLDTKTRARHFVIADNARYLSADNCPQDANKVLAEWTVPSGVRYLIVAAGPSGKYFEADSVSNMEK